MSLALLLGRLLLVAPPTVCWLGEEPVALVEALDEAAPGLSIKPCRRCRTELCARIRPTGLELRRSDGLRFLRARPGASLSALGPAQTAVFLQSLVLEAELRPRAPSAPSISPKEPAPPPEPRLKDLPWSEHPVQGLSWRAPVRRRSLTGRSGSWRLGASAGARWRSPGLVGSSLGLDLAWRFLRLHVRGDLPSEGDLGGVQARFFGGGLGLGAGWTARSPRWTFGIEGGARAEGLRVRIDDGQGAARGSGFILGLGSRVHGALLIRRLELGVGLGLDAYPGGFELRIEGASADLPAVGAWGLTSEFSLRWRP